jgi:hypothetical protein
MLGFPPGIATRFSFDGRTLSADRWLSEGAELEDKPDIRVTNHFHNPLRSWTEAGLRVLFIQVGQSSALWQQNSNQDPNGSLNGGWSWQDARRRYHLALTTQAPAEREAEFARTFRNLGHLIHLIQDASVPAHVRNDPHLYKTAFGFDLLNPDGYERWVDKLGISILEGYLGLTPVRPPDIIYGGIPSLGTSVPVGRLIDADRYDGSNPEITTLPDTGLAEYTNANFFSGDTVLVGRDMVGSIPFPARTSIELGPREYVARLGEYRRYLWKVRHGESDYRTGVPSALHDYLPEAPSAKAFALDDRVFQDYAVHLLPRAVGYSAALLDYFFRGRFEATVQWDYPTNSYALRVTNRTAGEAMRGTLDLHYERANGTRQHLRTWGPLTLEPDQTSGPLSLPETPADQAQPGRYLLVFRGQLGEEPDAIAARWIGAGFYRVELWFDDHPSAPEEGGEVNFTPAAVPPGSANELFIAAQAFHNQWRFYCCDASYHGGGGESHGASVTHMLWPPELFQGSIATIRFYGQCYGGDGGSPVVADLVALEPPHDFATLEGLTWATQPAVTRVLGQVTSNAGDWSGAQTATVDLGGATFLGLQLVSVPLAPLPPTPPPFPPFTTTSAQCKMVMSIQPKPSP